MVKIDSSTFGSITIDGKIYNHDVYIFPSGKVEEREHSHVFSREQIEYLLEENPEIVIVGKGVSGLASLSSEARDFLEKKGIEILEGNTQDVKDKFNELSENKRVAGILHITC